MNNSECAKCATEKACCQHADSEVKKQLEDLNKKMEKLQSGLFHTELWLAYYKYTTFVLSFGIGTYVVLKLFFS